MTRPWHERLAESLVFLLLVVAVLDRGGKTLETTWLLVGVAGLVTVIACLEHRRPFDKLRVTQGEIPPLLWWCSVGFVAWTALSYLTSTTRNYGLDELLRDGSLILLFFWAARNSPASAQPSPFGLRLRGRSDSRSKQFSILHSQFPRLLSLLTLLVCAIGVFIYILQPVDRFVGTFFDPRFYTDYWPNAFAQFLLLTWPVVLWHITANRKVRDRSPSLEAHVLRSCPLGFILGCLLLTYSRGALIAFTGQLALLALFSRGRALRQWRPALATLCVALATFLAVNGLRSQFFPVQAVGEKISFTAAEKGTSISERRQFWEQAWALAKEKPLLGWGPYSFRFIQPRLQTDVLATSDHPHNVFLKLAMERGWPAALLFLAIVGQVLLSARRAFFNTSLKARSYALAALLAVVGVLAHNLIDYNLQFVGIALPFWLLLGTLAAKADQSPLKATRYTLKAGLELLLTLVLLFITLREGIFLTTSSLGRHAEARGDTSRALVWYQRSSPEWFSRDMLLSQAQIEIRRRHIKAARDTLSLYFEENEEDGRAWRLAGDLAIEQGSLTFAFHFYNRAYQLTKWNDLSPTRALLDLHLRRNDWTALQLWKPNLLNLVGVYRKAIADNRHFIALGQNPPALLNILKLLRRIYPEEQERISLWMQEVRRETAQERLRLQGRGQGWLW